MLGEIGKLALFIASALVWMFRPPWYGRQILRLMIDIGYFSLPVVGLTTMFSGMVIALQSYTGTERFSAEGEASVATVVVLIITRELGPVLAGLMVAGRIGAAMAAEIGTMRVTDQIDALDTLSTRPMQYLIAPRVIAATLCLPFLVVIGDIIGVFGGYVIAIYQLGFSPSVYLAGTLEHLEAFDVIIGLIKAAVFGFIVAIMGCFFGYFSGRGAEGVGRATTNAVVYSAILILVFDFFITGIAFVR
ncbi:MAG: ABC transporter permease [Proteobacteria bacterium]|nr:ABC transporter permease [Pseudomonadota bacterium]